MRFFKTISIFELPQWKTDSKASRWLSFPHQTTKTLQKNAQLIAQFKSSLRGILTWINAALSTFLWGIFIVRAHCSSNECNHHNEYFFITLVDDVPCPTCADAQASNFCCFVVARWIYNLFLWRIHIHTLISIFHYLINASFPTIT